MKKQREDFDPPEIEAASVLNDAEHVVVYRELMEGASETALAIYFNTTIREIRVAKERGDYLKWRSFKRKK